jgi:hypothetical protein
MDLTTNFYCGIFAEPIQVSAYEITFNTITWLSIYMSNLNILKDNWCQNVLYIHITFLIGSSAS